MFWQEISMVGKGGRSTSGKAAAGPARPASRPGGGSADRPADLDRSAPARPAAAGTSASGGSRQGRVTDYVRRIDTQQRFQSPSKRARSSETRDDSPASSAEDFTSRCRGDAHLQPDSPVTVGVMQQLLCQERDSLRSFLREEISRVTEVLRAELNEQSSRIQQLEQHVEAQGVVIDELERRLLDREDRTAGLEEALDQVEADQKCNDLIFSGTAVPPRPSPPAGNAGDNRGGPLEDVTDVTISMLRRHLPAIELKREDIVSCRRIGNGKKILCKFSRGDTSSPRYQLYDKRFALKDSPPENKLFINEHLSKRRLDIFQKLLQEKGAKRLHSVFSKNGVVFCTVMRYGRKIRVTSADQIPHALRE